MKRINALMLSLLIAFFGLCSQVMAQGGTTFNLADYNFSGSTKVDGLTYALDKSKDVAQWLAYQDRNCDMAKDGVITVPAQITVSDKTYKVISVMGAVGYYNESPATDIVLPEGLLHIGRYAFDYYNHVNDIDIPKSLVAIDQYAFSNAKKSNNLVLRMPKGCFPTATAALSSTYANATYQAPFKTHYIKVRCHSDYFKDFTETQYWEDCVIINDDLDAENYSDVKWLTIDRVENGTLGYAVVADALPQVRTYKEVNFLKVNAGSLNEDDWYALRQMKNLVKLDINGMEFTSVPNDALRSAWQLEDVILTNTIEKIGQMAFYETGIGSGSKYQPTGSHPRDFILPSSLKTLGQHAFYSCDSLHNVILPAGLTNIPNNCFYGSENLNRVDINDKPTVIDYSAFGGCNLYEVFIPGNIETINSSAFASNPNMTSVTLSEGLKTLDRNAFEYCTSLYSLTTPTTLRYMGEYCFYKCDSLHFVNLKEGLEEIGRVAFGLDKKIKSIVFPSTLRIMGSGTTWGAVLYECTGLESIQCNSLIPPTVRENCQFSGSGCDPRNVYLLVPEWSIQEYMTTPGWVPFQNKTMVSAAMPENLYINREFMFMFKHQAEDYRPTVRLFQNDQRIDDGFGQTKYERGNLTVAAVSNLNVKNLEMIVSPWAKYYTDQNLRNGYNYESTYTTYTPNSLLVHGTMGAEKVTLTLQLRRDTWQALHLPGVKMEDIKPVDPNTQVSILTYNTVARAAGDLGMAWEPVTPGKTINDCFIKCYNSDSKYASAPIEFEVTVSNPEKMLMNAYERKNLGYALAADEHNASWYLVGNSFPCFFDSRYMSLSDVSVDGHDYESDQPIMNFLVWNSYTGKYDAYSRADDKYIFSPFEAFFVEGYKDATNLYMGMDRDGRQTYFNPREIDYRSVKGQFGDDAKSTRELINLVASKADGTDADRTRIVVSESASLKYDTGRDMSKMMPNEGNVLLIWTVEEGHEYAINERPMDNGTMTLAMNVAEDGMYKIALGDNSSSRLDISIEDLATGKVVKMGEGDSYEFYAEKGRYANRFLVHVGAGEETAVSTVAQDEKGGASYNLNGQRVADDARGVVVKSGKKFIKK